MSEPLNFGLHPDADSLSAFAEGALPEHERTQCLAHLAECAECREIVFLAREPVDVAAAATAARTAWWKTWFGPIPVFAALAGLVIAASVGMYRVSRHETSASPVAAVVQPPAPPPVADNRASSAQPRVASPAPRAARPVAAAPPPEAEKPVAAAVPSPKLPSQTNEPAAAFLEAPSPLPLRSATPPALSGVTGTVTDPAGAVIARADVNLRGIAGGDARTANTDSAGQFNFAGLAPGRYEMQIVAPGFARTQKEIDLPPQGIATADSVLSVGAAAETVTVTAGSPLLRAESDSATRVRANRTASVAVLSSPDLSRYVLPGKRPATAAAARGSIVLATNPDGALFLSRNSGKSWKAVKAPWQGKVMQLVTPGSNDSAFRLTTDSGAIWISRDGSRWDPAIASK